MQRVLKKRGFAEPRLWMQKAMKKSERTADALS